MTTPGPFAGLRVLDLGQYLAGPLVAMLLADGGADVIHVDPPGGPRWRHPANVALQRGKRSVELDLHSPSGVARARDLALGADVLIEGFRPGVLARLGLDPGELLSANPALVCCSLPGFGSDDERAGLAGWELIVSAAGGLYRSGSWFSPSEAPVFSAMPLASGFAAFSAAHAVVAALMARLRDGRGQRVEVPLFDALFQLYGHFATGPVDAPPAGPPATANMAWIDRFRCADGRWVDVSPPFRGLAAFGQRWFPADAVEAGHADPFNPSPEAAEAVTALLTELFASRSAQEWERLGSSLGMGIAVCQTAAEWLDDEHARASGCVVAVEDPGAGPVLQAGHLVQLGATPFVARAAVGCGGSGDSVPIGWAGPSIAPPLTAGADDRPPLAGLSVVDLTQVLAGPTAGRILAGYGADVVKINDPLRANPTAFSGHAFVNAGKRSTLVDLRDPAGLELLHRLAASADVVHQNFARGAADRLGFGEGRLREIRPDVIFSSINTHADGGWRSGHRGHEELGQAVTGMQTRLGGDGIPTRASWTVCDYATGHASAFGILTALYHRARTGEGQAVQASLSASATVLQLPFLVATPGRAWDEPSGQAALGWGPAHRLYRAADGWVAVAAGGIDEIARALGLAAGAAAAGNDAEALVAGQIAAGPAGSVLGPLAAAGIAAHRYTTMAEVLADSATAARGLAVVDNGQRVVLAAPRLSRTPVVPLGPAPVAGQDSLAVAAAVLGTEAADVLVGRGVVAGA